MACAGTTLSYNYGLTLTLLRGLKANFVTGQKAYFRNAHILKYLSFSVVSSC